jgi:predicted alpha/beta-fold hydrolase
VLRMNMRGAGDSEALCPRLYNAGLDTDLHAVLVAAARHVPRIAVAGFSLGANLALLTAGRLAARLPAEVKAFAAVSPPVDLATSVETFERGLNRLYSENFLRELKDSYRSRQRRLPELYAAGLERGIRGIRAYDEAITARYGGYRDAAHYYTSSSAGSHLASIDRPTLVLAAEDDPLIPCPSITCWPLSDRVQREITATGGHVGFVAKTRAPGSFWAAERVVDFLGAHSAQSPLSR